MGSSTEKKTKPDFLPVPIHIIITSLSSSMNSSAICTFTAWPALKQAKLSQTLNTQAFPPQAQPMKTFFFNINKTRGILKLRPAQRNPAEFHKYRRKYRHVTKPGRKHYIKTDDTVVLDLPMLQATAKRSVEASVVFAKFESLQKITLTIYSVATRLCTCPTVPSPASWAKWLHQLTLWIYGLFWGAGMF